MEEITTISDLYAAFGGAAAIAEFLDVSRSASGNWSSEGKLPAHHFPKIHDALAEKGKKVSQSLFRFTRKKPEEGSPFRISEQSQITPETGAKTAQQAPAIAADPQEGVSAEAVR